MAEKKSKTKDPYTSRNEFKKGFYEQSDKPPITSDTMYGTDRNIIQEEMAKVDQLGNYTGGRSPEDYKFFKETPYQKGSYKEGGDIHIEKGESYIKDLIK